jgi:hypothetical protein
MCNLRAPAADRQQSIRKRELKTIRQSCAAFQVLADDDGVRFYCLRIQRERELASTDAPSVGLRHAAMWRPARRRAVDV